MKKKFLFFSIGVVSILSCAAALSFAPHDKVAKATDPIDLGEVNFFLDPAASCLTWDKGVYMVSDVQNSMPYDWSNRLYPVGTGSAIFNGNDMYSASEHRIHICKYEVNKYYIAFSDYLSYYSASRSEGDTITIKGTWTSTMQGSDYILSINEFTAVWSNGRWKQNFIVPELEVYDKISLPQIAADDYDGVTIDTEDYTTGWNSWTPSANNTTNSFVFEFLFEAYTRLDKTLFIRFGGEQPWEGEHCYRLGMNNTWGPAGVIIYDEMALVDNNPTQVHKSGDLECNLQPGARHTIELASIVVKNSDKVYNYLKFDGEYLYQEVFTPTTLARTTRVGMHYDQTNIFVGGTTTQKENTDVLTFDRGNRSDGIYMFGPQNDIPVLADWKTRGAPASKYNMLKNGEMMYDFKSTDAMPLIKHQADQYYFAFSDYGVTFNKGDAITIGGEFHFYPNRQAYTMAIVPFTVEWNGQQFVFYDDLDNYLIERLNDNVSLDYYEGDNVALVTSLLQATQTSIVNATGMKAKWDAYNQGIANINEIPMSESKLNEYKLVAIAELNALVNEELYEPEQLEIVQGYVDAGAARINAATSVKQINDIIEEVKAQIATVMTKQTAIEQKILALAEGYEQYLSRKDVITTTDLDASGDWVFRALRSNPEGYNTGSTEDGINARFSPNSDNPEGNAVMQFKYRSNNPASNAYGSQIFLRMRGTGSNCYMFNIARNNDGVTGISMGRFVQDVLTEEQFYAVNFVANTDYTIECGAIDLKNYDRVFTFVKVNGSFILKNIIDKLEVAVLPTVLIMDSATKQNTEDYAIMSAIEEGTTKVSNSQLLGRTVLDNNSNAEALNVTLRKNNIPVGAKLYPMEENAYTYNGEDITSEMHVLPRIVKTSDNKYTISLAGLELQDGDVIHVGGCYSYFDEDYCAKTIYRFFDTAFTYNASSDSWSQSAPSLEAAKLEAIDYLNNYVDLDNYSEENQTRIENTISMVTAQINSATTNEEVEQYLNNGIASIDAIPTLLDEYKISAQQELNNYKSADLYRDEEKAELRTILNNAFARIDACTDKDSIDYIVMTTKQQIDALKTAAEYEAEELASEKRVAKTEIETYIGLLEIGRYSDENAAKIQQLALKARSDVDAATSIEEVRQIVAQFKEDIKNVPTKDGSTFDGEKYIEKGNQKKGCGGEIISISIIVPILSLVALILLVFYRKKYILSK